jgi:RimJ/RimL family protein N-acetyltransferase
VNASAPRRAQAIETSRLLGTPLSDRHFAELRLLHSDLRVMATLSADGKPAPESQTHEMLQNSAEHWQKHPFGLWAFRERSNGDFAGYCGIKWTEVDGTLAVELAYAFRFEVWYHGYAHEAAMAALEYGFDAARLDEIVAFTLVSNDRSQRVLERCGFRRDRAITRAGLPHLLYRISRAEFRRKDPPA